MLETGFMESPKSKSCLKTVVITTVLLCFCLLALFQLDFASVKSAWTLKSLTNGFYRWGVFKDNLHLTSNQSTKIKNQLHGEKSLNNTSHFWNLPDNSTNVWFTFAVYIHPKSERTKGYGVVAPLTAYAEHRIYGARAFVVFITDSEQPSALETFLMEWLKKANAHVKVVPFTSLTLPNGTLKSTVAQCIRLCNSLYENFSDEDYLFTGDADTLPFNLEKVPRVSGFTLWQYHYALSGGIVPMAYISGTVRLWKEAFTGGSSNISSCVSNLFQRIAKQGLFHPLDTKYEGSRPNPQWYLDQDLASYGVAPYCSLPLNMKNWWKRFKGSWKVPEPSFGPLKSQCAGSGIRHVHHPSEFDHKDRYNDWHIAGRLDPEYLKNGWQRLFKGDSDAQVFFNNYIKALMDEKFL